MVFVSAQNSRPLVAQSDIETALHSAGLQTGDVAIVHASMSRLG